MRGSPHELLGGGQGAESWGEGGRVFQGFEPGLGVAVVIRDLRAGVGPGDLEVGEELQSFEYENEVGESKLGSREPNSPSKAMPTPESPVMAPNWLVRPSIRAPCVRPTSSLVSRSHPTGLSDFKE